MGRVALATVLSLVLAPLAGGQNLPFSFRKTVDAKGQDTTKIDPTALQEDFEYIYKKVLQQKAYTASIQVPTASTSVAGTVQWSNLTGFPANCSLPSVTVGVGGDLVCSEPSNITGNAATVTTNANLTGPVTSVGNVTSIAGPFAGVGNGFTFSTNVVVSASMTVQGSAFSVGGSSFAVYGGSASLGYQLVAGSIYLTGSTSTIITASSVTASAFFGDASHLLAAHCGLDPGGSGGSVLCSPVGNGGGAPNTYATSVGGHINVANGQYSTVVGGDSQNGGITAGDYSFVGGGRGNKILGSFGTIPGGDGGQCPGSWGTVSGGQSNTANANYSTVGGGLSDIAAGVNSTVGGGNSNNANGNYSTVPGGDNCTAQGLYTFAAGRRAKANYDGSFVMSDSQNADLTNSTSDQLLVRFQGGVSLQTSSLTVTGVILSSTTQGSISCTAGTGVLSTSCTDQHCTFAAGTLATACTYTFAKPWPKTPDCLAGTNAATPIAVSVTSPGTTSITLTAAAAMTGDNVTFLCNGAP